MWHISNFWFFDHCPVKCLPRATLWKEMGSPNYLMTTKGSFQKLVLLSKYNARSTWSLSILPCEDIEYWNQTRRRSTGHSSKTWLPFLKICGSEPWLSNWSNCFLGQRSRAGATAWVAHLDEDCHEYLGHNTSYRRQIIAWRSEEIENGWEAYLCARTYPGQIASILLIRIRVLVANTVSLNFPKIGGAEAIVSCGYKGILNST